MRYLDFFGTKILWTCQNRMLKLVDEISNIEGCHYIAYANVHTTVTAKNNLQLRAAINNAYFASPDGMPLVVVGRGIGAKCIQKCSGPDMMDTIIKSGLNKGYNHYFYGSTEKTLTLLKKRLTEKYPGIKIAGLYSPPFRALTKEEDNKIIDEINLLSPDYIWVGLGAPKQEIWMYEHKNKLNKGIMFGVGAAFDFHAETLKRAPNWMQKSGLEWFYRLLKEPRRLWKRYLITNTLFICYLLRYGVRIKGDKTHKCSCNKC